MKLRPFSSPEGCVNHGSASDKSLLKLRVSDGHCFIKSFPLLISQNYQLKLKKGSEHVCQCLDYSQASGQKVVIDLAHTASRIMGICKVLDCKGLHGLENPSIPK